MSLNQIANAVRHQLEQYAENIHACLADLSDEQIWAPGPDGSNSIGTLTHHLSGNLRHFFGAGLLSDGYKRDKTGEFEDRNLSSAQLKAELEEALQVSRAALETVDTQVIDAPHRSVDGREFPSLAHMLLTMATHFSYHTGQINYAKRIRTEHG